MQYILCIRSGSRYNAKSSNGEGLIENPDNNRRRNCRSQNHIFILDTWKIPNTNDIHITFTLYRTRFTRTRTNLNE